MKKSERDKLRKLAEAATPGPWQSSDFYGLSEITEQFERTINTKDCRYSAAANPAAILALLDRMEKLEKVAEAAKKAHSLIVDTWPEPVDYEDMEYLRIALSALTKEQDDDA